MSVFGPNQVEEVIIGDAVAAETTTATFIASATDKEIKCLSADGTAPALGANFKVLQKTAANSPLNYEFSDVVEADKVENVILKEYSGEVQKSDRVEGFDGNVVSNTTYSVELRIYNDGGSLSVENFAIVSGYYSTGASVAGVTAADIRDGIVAGLNHNLLRRGDNEFVITTPDATETDILITGAYQAVVPGKIIGSQMQFDVTAKQFDDTAVNHENLNLLSVTSVASNAPGTGTGKYAVNLEWFTKGYKYEVYRQTGFPADFTERTPFYASSALNYNAIHVKYKSRRRSPGVEEQPKVLTILVERANLAGNSNTNDVLADLRTILGTAAVPADLAVV
ncbi:MAG: hypothetical protein KUG81_10835 [Gammaproteobacteria bacterium]|nr:hypothetical protein [Gammaproteobacteria bacterium]